MAWMQCRSCSAKFAVGLLRCPQCEAVSELFAVPEEVVEAEEEAAMPKITVASGPSNALDPAEAVAAEGPQGEQETAEAVTEPAVAEAAPDLSDEAVPDAAEAAEPTPAPAPKRRAAKKTAASSES